MSLLQKRLEEQQKESESNQDNSHISVSNSKREVMANLTRTIMSRLVDSIDPEELEKLDKLDQEKFLSQEVRSLTDTVLKEENHILSRIEYQRLIGQIISEVTGFGPITHFLSDSTINEIMVNGPYQIYIEQNGRLVLTDVRFEDNNHLMHIIERIVAPLGRRIDESSPMVDARLPDGSRVNAIIPPLALNGPVLTIRKFSATPLSISDIVRMGTLSSNMSLFLKACTEGCLNTIVSGGTGSGKTTTLNVLSSFIPNHQRIVTIEDAAELQLQQDHVIRLESRQANIEGRGRISIRDLVINSLRMRPDRIVVGEVRGGEALDMMQAMNTGHEGSMTTAHANSPRDLLSRLETMVLMAGVELPIKAIREQAISALDLIVFQARMKDGTRKITNITEVIGMEGETITLQDIFVFEQTGVDRNGKVIGYFKPTGVIPTFIPKLEAKGIHVPVSIFSREEW